LKARLDHIHQRVKNLSAHGGVRKYFFNTGWMFAEKALRLVAGLFIGAYVARYLGASQYGLFNYALSIVSVFSVLGSVGLDSIVVRELVSTPANRDTILGTAYAMKVIGALVSLALLTIITFIIEPEAQTRHIIFIVATLILCDGSIVIDLFFQSKVQSRFVVISQMCALSAVSIFRIILVYNNASLASFAWTNTLDQFVLSLCLLIFYHKLAPGVSAWKVDWKYASALFKQSWPLIFSALSIIIYMRIDQMMIKWMLGDEANGHYGVAVRLSELFNFIPIAICNSVFPAILNAKTMGVEMYNRRLQWLFDLMTTLSIAIALCMTVVGPYAVELLYGEEFSAAAGVLLIYVWSGVFVFLGAASSKWVVSEGLQVFRMWNLIISCTMNIVLNLILIKSIGLHGAAWSTLISYAFASYFGFAFLKKTRPLFWRLTSAFNFFRIIGSLVGKR
jgi:O-antigen/teichoic acid export membrane protein